MIKITLPDKVKRIINRFEENGFSAYAVGGCVRDSVMGLTPNDWDIATSALPCDVKEIFGHTIDTGIKHGTVTVIEDGESFEITTFRCDGRYIDGRRPDTVDFVRDIKVDLMRRDFTINAMAYNGHENIVDPFGGIEDIKRGIIRTVGMAEDRFSEDALRILRAVRFSAAFSFKLDSETFEAFYSCAGRLTGISGERLFAEFNKIFKKANHYQYNILKTTGIFAAVLPEAEKTDFSAISADMSDFSEAVRWLLVCGEAAPDVLLRLRASRALCSAAAELSKFAHADVSDFKRVASALRYVSFKEVCDLTGSGDAYKKYSEAADRDEPIYMKELRVSADALKRLGFSGKGIGTVKKRLLEHVWQFPDDNNEKKLISLAIKMRGDEV